MNEKFWHFFKKYYFTALQNEQRCCAIQIQNPFTIFSKYLSNAISAHTCQMHFQQILVNAFLKCTRQLCNLHWQIQSETTKCKHQLEIQ